MPTLRVMTYNILFGEVGRETRIREIVDAIAPDVAVFTEVTSMVSFDAIAGVVGPHRASAAGRERVAIVSRWPILHSHLLGPRWAPNKYVDVTLRPSGGPAISVCGIHLVPMPLWPCEVARRVEIRTLLRHIEPRPGTSRILAGDFNTLMPGDPFRRDGAPLWVRAPLALQRGWPAWALQQLIDAGYTDCYRACHPSAGGFTAPAWNPGVRLDYVFASASVRPALKAADVWKPEPSAGSSTLQPRRSLSELLGWTPVRSLGDAASDHLPVWADFEWP